MESRFILSFKSQRIGRVFDTVVVATIQLVDTWKKLGRRNR